jgi:serine/threonine-protein kinase
VAKIRRGAPAASLAPALRPRTVSMTKSGEILGSPLYMSPEQVDGARHIDARSDVFSMGVTLRAMLVGRAPYAHIRSLVQLLYTIVNDPAPPIAVAAPWVPADVAAVVDRAMAHDPGTRFADAAVMLEALRACAPEEGPIEEGMLVAGEPQVPVPEPVSPTAPTQQASEERPGLWRRFLGSWR